MKNKNGCGLAKVSRKKLITVLESLGAKQKQSLKDAGLWNQIKYPYINKLKIPIHSDKSIDYIDSKELAKILKKYKINKIFSEYFGAQTAFALDNGNAGFYIYDVEAVLHRIFANELIGSQLIWD